MSYLLSFLDLLQGTLILPANATGLVIFAHGSGSGRFSPRNRQVAAALNSAGSGTLLMDLLTPAEAADRSNVFDIPKLADRVVLATRWMYDNILPGAVDTR